jgi:hypothetical protein
LGFCLLTIFSHQTLGFVPYNPSCHIVKASSKVKKISPSLLWASTSSPENKMNMSDSVRNNEPALRLLEEAIGFHSSSASTLLDNLQEMRESGTPRESMDDLLNRLLSSGPDAALPFWARSMRLARYSRRARMASLRRTLDMTTPPPSENGANESKEQSSQRRRRALVTLLRSLSDESTLVSSKVPAIVSLEQKARQASREDAETLRSRLPEGLETPDYEVLAQRRSGRSNVEIRRYQPYSVCSVSMNKARPDDSSRTDAKLQMPEMSGASSFGALAGYLFGKNDKSTAMKMTTPVFTAPGNEADEKQMQFVLPSKYWDSGSLTTAPQPLAESGVTLQQKESENRAVLMFGGYASKKEVEKRIKDLGAAMFKDSEWEVIEEDSATVAQYNDPFTVPWRRVNEVSVKVLQK